MDTRLCVSRDRRHRRSATEVNAKTYNALADAGVAATMDFVADTGAQNDDQWRVQAADSGAFTISSFSPRARAL